VNRPLRFPEHRKEELRRLVARSHQVLVLSALTGAATGLVVALFEHVVVELSVERVVRQRLWVVALMPAIGLLVAFAVRHYVGRRTSAATADEYLHAFHDSDHELSLRDFFARMLAAVATLGSGAPMGLEGPSLYAGATIGSNLQRRWPTWFGRSSRRTLLVAGAAAGVAAIFKAPATGAVFALEVPYQEDLARRMLLPALVSSASGYLVFVAFHGTDPLFQITGAADFSLRDLLGAVAVGMLAGIGARGFAWLLRRAKSLAGKGHPLVLTVGAGGGLAAAFALGRLLTGESLLIGPGYDVVAWAIEPGRSIGLMLGILALRCLGTAFTVAGGGSGGLFIPLVVAGALTGSIIGNAVNPEDLTLFVVIGVAAFLGAGYRVPLAAVMFVAETSGRPTYIVPGLVSAVAAQLLMGPASVTTYQRASTPMQALRDES
jgi:CIC family chloride channel protein